MQIHRFTKTAVGAALALGALVAQATPISITGSIFGDPRTPFNDLRIDVTVSSDTTSNVAQWTVDIVSPNHPNAKLDQFYFSMLGGIGGAGAYSFSGFNPQGWTITSPSTPQGGGTFTPVFVFESNGPNGNQNQVTNAQDLTFTMTKSTGNFTAADFLSAPASCSTTNLATADDCGQLGAHLQSLQQGLSAFLIGNYDGGGAPPNEQVPEPASLALIATALLGLSLTRRRA